MPKFTAFLRSRAYRKTFFSYLVLVLLFIVSVVAMRYQNIRMTAKENFTIDAASSFQRIDRQAADITSSIDQFMTQLYASPGRLQDFFLFFGSTVSDYVQAKLDSNLLLDESYLESCDSLVLSSQYTIRHMLYYSRDNLVDMEYNALGYSRQHLISPEKAEALCNTNCVYQKDIHQDSTYLGKISFVLDLSDLGRKSISDLPHAAQSREQAVCLILPESTLQLGSLELAPEDTSRILQAGQASGIIELADYNAYYALYASEHLPYSLIYLAPVRQYLQPQMNQILLLIAGLVLGFTAITALLIHRFSQDAVYVSSILSSMSRAAHSDFTPLALTGQNDEFDAIVTGLNRLYAHLDSLIQQEYKLTISQQKAQMDMLSTQLSPHFLYNTLERIRMRAVLEHAPDVAEGIAHLGLLYRNIVKTEPVIPMKREVEITRQYLDLMAFLYGEQLLYHLDIDPEVEQVLTPKIWMQPIVENFFKHNFQQDDRLKVVVIEAERLRGGMILRLFDNIGRLEPEQLQELNALLADADSEDCSGVGLRNVAHRLRLYYGKRVSMTVENNQPAGICFCITLKEEGFTDVSIADRG